MLNPKETLFLTKILQSITHANPDGDPEKAYLEVYKKDIKNPQGAARRLLKRINEGHPELTDVLDTMGYGLDNFLVELRKSLAAKKTIFYQGKKIEDVIDNTTRFNALLLWADLLGLRKRDEGPAQVDKSKKNYVVVNINPGQQKDSGVTEKQIEKYTVSGEGIPAKRSPGGVLAE